MTKLTPKQKRFIDEYLFDLNATQAAIRAGYSERSANRAGARLLSKVDIQAKIQEAMAERSQRTAITADQVVNELAAIAFSNMGDYFTFLEDGQVNLNWSNMPPEASAAIHSISQDVTSTGGAQTAVRTRLKLHDKVGALYKLGLHLGMFKLQQVAAETAHVKIVTLELPSNDE